MTPDIKNYSKLSISKPIDIEINSGIIIKNLQFIKTLTGREVCAVLKSNAYGYGIDMIAPCLKDHISSIGICTNEEAHTLRTRVGFNGHILRLRPATEKEIHEQLHLGLEVQELAGTTNKIKEIAKLSSNLGSTCEINICLDSFGMGRNGCNDIDINSIVNCIITENKSNQNVTPIGVMAHIPHESFDQLEIQCDKFILDSQKLKESFNTVANVHCFGSHFAINPQFIPKRLHNALTMDRVGCAIFGHMHSSEISKSQISRIATVSSTVSDLFFRNAESSVGYGGKYTVEAKNGEWHANIPVGWLHFPKQELYAQSSIYVMSHNQSLHRIIGTPSMNTIICKCSSDFGDYTLKAGDKVTFYSPEFDNPQISQHLNHNGYKHIGSNGGSEFLIRAGLSGDTNFYMLKNS